MHRKEKTGKTCLQVAARAGNVNVVDMLIKADRQRALRMLNATCSEDNHRCFYGEECGLLKEDDGEGYSLSKIEYEDKLVEILFTLSQRHLKAADWKSLAHYWRFSDEHVKAIEHQYTGSDSYKEHSYRLLLIWLYGVPRSENALKVLFEALCAIGKRTLAGK